MGALETVKEIARMATTATLTKDVIDLLKEKVGLLGEQVTTLEQEKAALKTENTNLQQKVAELESKVAELAPISEELDKTEIRILRYLFERGECTLEYAMAELGISRGMAEFHRDRLVDRLFISRGGFVGTSMWGDGEESLGTISIKPEGRAYLVERRRSEFP